MSFKCSLSFRLSYSNSVSSPLISYMVKPPHPPWFYNPISIQWGIKILEFCIILFSQTPVEEQICFVILCFVTKSDINSTRPTKVLIWPWNAIKKTRHVVRNCLVGCKNTRTLNSLSQKPVAFVCMAYFVPDLTEIKLLWYFHKYRSWCYQAKTN
jgi:hypothetical protein